MNPLLQRLTVVGILTISIPMSLVWASKNPFRAHHGAGTGTYQLISQEDAANPFSGKFMDSLRLVIQAKRDKEKEVLIQISPETTVRILPQREISKLHFIPIEEFVFVDRTVKHIRP